MALPSATPNSIGERIHRLIVSEVISATTVEIAKRDYIYTICDSDDCLFLILKGQAKVVAVNPEGKESLLRIITPGDLAGESRLASGQRLDSAIAMTSTVVKRLRRDDVLAAMTDHGLRRTFVEFLAQRVCEQQRLITDLITVNSERRLASILLNLAQKMGHRVGPTLQLSERITQEELAAMVGTTRSRIGFFLKRFRESGILQSAEGRLLVFDEPRLKAFVEYGYLS